jgi:glycosyltransferase involved in cell wall biosynthesis
MRLLLSAFSCCPNHGSEPGVGWNTVREAAADANNEVHVMLAAPWRERIAKNFDQERHPNVHFHFVGVPGLDSFMAEGRGTMLMSFLYYHLWQIVSIFTAKRLHEEHRFDLAHHVTFVKFNAPSFLPLLGIPFLWGPVGGAEHAPAAFYREFGLKTRLMEGVRRALQVIAPLQPMLRWTARRAELAVGVTADSESAIKALGARRTMLFPAVGLNADELAEIKPATHEAKDELKLLYAGRLIPWKGVHLGLRALARSQNKRLRYVIAGDGPLRDWLEAETSRLGIAERVSFLGDVNRTELLAAYATADGFLYPSLHDSGGNAVIEAMAARLPVIHLAYGGPDLLVPEPAGYKVCASEPEEAVSGLTRALDRFCDDRDDRLKRADAARTHALETHAWSVRGKVLREMYASGAGIK